MAATCTTCQTALPDGAKFCIECGTRVVASCPSCGRPVARRSPSEVADAVAGLPEGTRVLLLAPLFPGPSAVLVGSDGAGRAWGWSRC